VREYGKPTCGLVATCFNKECPTGFHDFIDCAWANAEHCDLKSDADKAKAQKAAKDFNCEDQGC
jgi:hypothetical protein